MARKLSSPDDPKKKRPFRPVYKQYDPKVEGYGNVNDWGARFRAIAGDAIPVGRSDSALNLLELSPDHTQEDLKKAYRSAMMRMRDAFGENPSEEQTKDVVRMISAYKILNERFR